MKFVEARLEKAILVAEVATHAYCGQHHNCAEFQCLIDGTDDRGSILARDDDSPGLYHRNLPATKSMKVRHDSAAALGSEQHRERSACMWLLVALSFAIPETTIPVCKAR